MLGFIDRFVYALITNHTAKGALFIFSTSFYLDFGGQLFHQSL